jgi:hypothetical protein
MKALAQIDPVYAFRAAEEKKPEMLDVATALLSAARGRPAHHVATLIDATCILLAAVRETGDTAPPVKRDVATAGKNQASDTGGGGRKAAKPRRQLKTLRGPQAKPASAPKHPASSGPSRAAAFEADGVSICECVLSFCGKTVKLTPREAQLAAVMARAMPNLMDYRELAKRVWQRPFDDQAKGLVSQTAGVLRSKLATVGLDLKTVHGMGFALGTS